MKFLVLPGGIIGAVAVTMITYAAAQITSINLEVKDALTFGLTFGSILGAGLLVLIKMLFNLTKEVGELKGSAPPDESRVRQWIEDLRNEMQEKLTNIEMQTRYLHDHHKGD